MYALAFLVVVGIVVLVHEFGHLVAAKSCGVKVYEFAIGFGPRLFSWTRGDTLYAVRALPLGGLCRFAGMDDSDAAGEHVGEDDPRSFLNRPVWQRILIVVAGPLMNFLLAIVILSVIFASYGVPMATVVEVFQESPAAAAGFEADDTILSIDGKPVASVAGFINTIASSWGKELKVEVLREGRKIVLEVTPVRDSETNIGRVGMSLMEVPGKTGAGGAILGSFRYTWGIIDTTLTSMGAALSGRVKAEVAGPVGIAGMSAQAARRGFPSLMMLVALISTSLGLLNLMPIPVLDGGWVLLLIVEAARGKPLSPQVEGFLKFVGLALLVLLMIYATVSDISRLVLQRM